MAGVGSKSNALSDPQIFGVQVTTSIYNSAIPLLVGKRRTAGRLIWYGYFQPGPSNKKGKAAKKGITSYQSNLDLLISFGPIWNIQSTWSNSSLVGYTPLFAPNGFNKMGTQTFSVTTGDCTENADGTYTTSGTVSNVPSGFSLDFISAMSIIPSTPLSASINDYGDPLSPRTITESGLAVAWSSTTAYVVGNQVSYESSNYIAITANTNVKPLTVSTANPWQAIPNQSEQWLYNTYFNSGTPSTYAWRPGTWALGKPLCQSGHCTFPVGFDNGGHGWTVTLPSPIAGTITVYYGYTKNDHDTPLAYINCEFEPSLGSGNEFNGDLSGQQIIYPELSGAGGVGIDLGASGTAPELDIEAQGLYSLDKNGQANPTDIILDLILSGNIFLSAGSDTFTPLCFSHGLNFGGDPTRANLISDGFPGSYNWPPAVTFPYVVPSGGLFQILSDPPQQVYGVWSNVIDYSAGQIVLYTDGNYYKCLQSMGGGGTNPSSNPATFQNLGSDLSAFASDGLTDVRDYCTANNIFCGLLLQSQRQCSEVLEEICKIANCVAIWNGQSLDFYPLSEVSAVGGGTMYTPRTAQGPIASFDYRHFVAGENEAPVIVKQEGLQSVYNILDMNYSEANFDANGACGAGSYQSNSVRICDAQHAYVYGPMNGSPLGFDDYICDATTATNVGWPIMKRQRFADPYITTFKLPASVASLLDPMDLITVADASLFGGTQYPSSTVFSGPGTQDVRITSLEEDKGGTWTLESERFMYGMSAPNAPSVTGSQSGIPNQSTTGAGSVNTPYFFQPNSTLATALGMSPVNPLAIAVSGSAATYGGCQVYVSTDGGSSYQLLGTVTGSPAIGLTYNSDFPFHASPDNTNALWVNLTESNGELVSRTGGQQNQLIPIALIDGGATSAIPYEIVAYGSVTLEATSEYKATTPILRGQLATQPADHPISSVFVDLATSASIFKTTVPSTALTGQTIYFKFPSFNTYGAALQDLSDCTGYSYSILPAVVTGGPITINGQAFSDSYSLLINGASMGGTTNGTDINGSPFAG